MQEITASMVKAHLPERPADGHKGTFGHLFVVAGSCGFSGAAKMVCNAAYRSGCGLVTLGVPKSILTSVEAGLVETMTLLLPETARGTLSTEALEPIVLFAENKSAMVLGPGLSQQLDTRELVAKLVPELKLPLLIDADGLNNLAKQPEMLGKSAGGYVLTPHPGEMATLTGLTTKEVQSDREGVAAQYAEEWKSTVVLKGHRTVVATPGADTAVCPLGNSGMATGGSGDVLSGVIGSLMAQGVESHEAACLGVYAHARAGDLAAREKTERGLIARDVIETLPQVWQELEG